MAEFLVASVEITVRIEQFDKNSTAAVLTNPLPSPSLCSQCENCYVVTLELLVFLFTYLSFGIIIKDIPSFSLHVLHISLIRHVRDCCFRSSHFKNLHIQLDYRRER